MERAIGQAHSCIKIGGVLTSRKTVGCLWSVLGCFVLVGVMAIRPVYSQTTTDDFEVISVKPINRGTRGDAGTSQIQALTNVKMPTCEPNGRFVSFGVPITMAMGFAYNLDGRDVSVTPAETGPRGLPKWVLQPDGLYDIEAQAGGAMSRERCRSLVRQLLSDGFKLKIRFEAKEEPAYALVAAKNGPQHLARVTDLDQEPGVFIMVGGRDRTPSLGYATDARKGWTMDQLATYISTYTDRKVVDKTGLKGALRFTLTLPVGTAGLAVADDVIPAIEKQLGLKLELKTERLPTLVIDRLERPDPN